jgi:hypothetical protein
MSIEAAAMFRPTGWNVCAQPQAGALIVERCLALLQPARYHAYGMWPEINFPGKVPMAYSHELFAGERISQWMRELPGDAYMLFNEPERPEQAATTWQQAVDDTLLLMQMAREAGSPWQLCSPAVAVNMIDFDALGTEGWLTKYASRMRQYENIFRPAYWCIHPYRSGNFTQFRQSWALWKSWYATWGSGAPVILSEVCAEGSPLADQKAVMLECKRMLDRGEVAGVYWFIANGSAGMDWPTAALCNASGTARTALGDYWLTLK